MSAITQIRQGDVLLTRVAEPTSPVRACDADGQPLSGLRVRGERSSHEYVLPARVYDSDLGRVLFLERPTPLQVLDTCTGAPATLADGRLRHAPIEVPAGWWIASRMWGPPRPLLEDQTNG